MVTINGLGQASSVNRDGIKTHLLAHPEDALDLPTELIASILRAHMSDLNTDRVSEQSSAFAAPLVVTKASAKKAAHSWTWHEDKPDHSAIPGLPHCTNRFKLTKGLYFYSHSTDRCKRTPDSARAHKKTSEPLKLQAKVAEVEAANTTEQSPLSLDACLAYLHFGICDSAAPLSRASVFAYLAANHPEQLD